MADEIPHPNADQFRQHRVLSTSQRLDEHLTSAIAEFTLERPKIMRGMQRLANLAPTIMASLDAKADVVADKLVAQQAKAVAAIDQYDGLANSLGQVADTITAALGQITNDPTQVSGGS